LEPKSYLRIAPKKGEPEGTFGWKHKQAMGGKTDRWGGDGNEGCGSGAFNLKEGAGRGSKPERAKLGALQEPNIEGGKRWNGRRRGSAHRAGARGRGDETCPPGPSGRKFVTGSTDSRRAKIPRWCTNKNQPFPSSARKTKLKGVRVRNNEKKKTKSRKPQLDSTARKGWPASELTATGGDIMDST